MRMMDPCQAIPVKPSEEVTAAALLVEIRALKSSADSNFAEIARVGRVKAKYCECYCILYFVGGAVIAPDPCCLQIQPHLTHHVSHRR